MILLTGSSGFIGKAIFKYLVDSGVSFKSLSRKANQYTVKENTHYCIEMNGSSDFSGILYDVDTVIHAAGKAHRPAGDAQEQYIKVNLDSTLNLARQSAASGVKRFIFISTININGSFGNSYFTEADTPAPYDFTAKLKLEAENGLWLIQQETKMEVVIIRSPLVYGPNAPGNFGRLVHWLDKGVPLPLGIVHNKRSLIALANLVDVIILCVSHPAAANEMFLVADGEDISTSDLLRGVAKAMGKPLCLLPVPVCLLLVVASILGKKTLAHSLLGSLQVDTSKARSLLGWEPPLSVERGLARCFEKGDKK